METIRALTVGEALERFRQANGITRHEASNAFWTCQLGPIALRLPNFSWRRRAVIAHDLHHVFTGYPCTMRGEFQMAAWEFGAGSMPHWGASAICLRLVLIGLFWAPRLMLRAFLGGCRSSSLHESDEINRLLETPLHAARTKFIVSAHTRVPWPDYVRFTYVIVRASLTVFVPMAIVGAFGAALLAH